MPGLFSSKVGTSQQSNLPITEWAGRWLGLSTLDRHHEYDRQTRNDDTGSLVVLALIQDNTNNKNKNEYASASASATC